jgi:transcriptional regulator GlxA family with amidase domain
VTETHHDPTIHGLFKRCSEVFCGYSRYRTALLQTIVREIWLRLAEHWRSGDNPQVSRRMEQMVEFLRQHLHEPISRQDLAEQFSMTPEHINALFKKELGVTPTQLIHRERVYRAYQWIRNEGLSVKQAAEKVGFCDPFYFSKVFKRIMGLSPSEV